jgi:uncharacterized protein YlxP (DUF503 family)
MPIGLCLIQLRFSDATSVKDKRRITKSIIDRTRHRFNISIAEINMEQSLQQTSLAITTVSNSTPLTQSTLANVVNFIESTRLDIELLDYTIEISHLF